MDLTVFIDTLDHDVRSRLDRSIDLVKTRSVTGGCTWTGILCVFGMIT